MISDENDKHSEQMWDVRYSPNTIKIVNVTTQGCGSGWRGPGSGSVQNPQFINYHYFNELDNTFNSSFHHCNICKNRQPRPDPTYHKKYIRIRSLSNYGSGSATLLTTSVNFTRDCVFIIQRRITSPKSFVSKNPRNPAPRNSAKSRCEKKYPSREYHSNVWSKDNSNLSNKNRTNIIFGWQFQEK